jgi:hypothetical protein
METERGRAPVKTSDVCLGEQFSAIERTVVRVICGAKTPEIGLLRCATFRRRKKNDSFG